MLKAILAAKPYDSEIKQISAILSSENIDVIRSNCGFANFKVTIRIKNKNELNKLVNHLNRATDDGVYIASVRHDFISSFFNSDH